MAIVSGTSDGEILNGTSGDDTINAFGGDDTIFGYAGNDTIWAGDGDDRVDAGDGDDSVIGDGGNDFLDGGCGNDTIMGNHGADTIIGGDGDDSLLGGADNDVISGGLGNDTIEGGSGEDSIEGGSGNDIAYGGLDNDTVLGNEGDDRLFGDGGDDTIVGGAGHDFVSGGLGNDLVYGDDPGGHPDGSGNDTLKGNEGDDTLDGGHGRDLLDGGTGADQMTGGEGFDTFIASEGADTILDFNTAAGQDFNDGDQTNNDFIDLSGYYNDANLALINAQREEAGQPTYGNPLAWLRGDQADGVLNDLAGQTIGDSVMPTLDLTIQKDGAAVAGKDLTWDNTNVCCFGADTMIRTAKGEVEARSLSVGDLVETRDAGMQAIRWIGRRSFDSADLTEHPNLRPIRITRGALGSGLPEMDLIISPQHRMLVRSKIAQKMFGAMEVLVAAKQLCQLDGIDVAEDLTEVSYVHFLFEDHQIVLANGAEAESLHTGAEALKSVGPAAVEEIFAIFPELRQGRPRPAARMLPSGRLGRKLVVRHLQNRKPLVM
ncbi:Hint domain-containing protein [Paracoccus sp. S1E-3]|uniref:Hint domain-containing protein n=1 Tax=Paracoccus sp. S1E-3 TaxID=2756130 RepID=UPI0015EE3F9D|nr:Hint domain-containing protein [Paracoccus sp. S1E-3]MBA4489846.1 Hint domain-containing protein [Paracoccus sp. S1E-3]